MKLNDVSTRDMAEFAERVMTEETDGFPSEFLETSTKMFRAFTECAHQVRQKRLQQETPMEAAARMGVDPEVYLEG